MAFDTTPMMSENSPFVLALEDTQKLFLLLPEQGQDQRDTMVVRCLYRIVEINLK